VVNISKLTFDIPNEFDIFHRSINKIKPIKISTTKRLVIIDGSSLLFRAYYAVPQILSNYSEPVGAIYGFIQSLKFILRKVFLKTQQAFLTIALDVGGGQNFRYEIYKSYKQNRRAAPVDLIFQLQLVRTMLDSFGIKYVYDQYSEADDVIGAYAKHGIENGYEVVVVSGDKDLMQLISDKIMFYDIITKRFCTVKDVYDKFGVMPNQICDYLAIVGDKSDNIPGIRGIGNKIAADLLKTFNTLDGIYLNIDKIPQLRIRDILQNGYESAYLSKRLVVLKQDVDLQYALDDMKWNGFQANALKISDFLARYALDSLINF
jgi:DNA polymerase-1